MKKEEIDFQETFNDLNNQLARKEKVIRNLKKQLSEARKDADQNQAVYLELKRSMETVSESQKIIGGLADFFEKEIVPLHPQRYSGKFLHDAMPQAITDLKNMILKDKLLSFWVRPKPKESE